jgi:hypothetical protein
LRPVFQRDASLGVSMRGCTSEGPGGSDVDCVEGIVVMEVPLGGEPGVPEVIVEPGGDVEPGGGVGVGDAGGGGVGGCTGLIVEVGGSSSAPARRGTQITVIRSTARGLTPPS